MGKQRPVWFKILWVICLLVVLTLAWLALRPSEHEQRVRYLESVKEKYGGQLP